MQRRNFLQQLLVLSCGGLGVTSTGCGTILHSERVHRPHSRDIDWEIAALNGLGLALFFVPGVLAFVVDFYTGAIYLPPAGGSGYPVGERESRAGADPTAAGQVAGVDGDWDRQSLPVSELKPARIEQLVQERTGKVISLSESQTRVSKLATWRQFGDQVRRHLRDPGFGLSPREFFTRSTTT